MRTGFNLSHRPRHTKLALIAAILAFFVIMLGAYTRLTDAGLSCPDWPNCFGFVTAPHTAAQLSDAARAFPQIPVNIKKAWTEMTHRYFAGTEGLLVLLLAFSTLYTPALRNRPRSIMSIGLIALLALQVILGMLTVTAQLKPVIVLSHLVTGLSLLSLLWVFYLSARNQRLKLIQQGATPSLWACWVALVIICMQITLGGWVSTHYAGLACIDLPYCNGQLLPTLQWHKLGEDLITMHMLHRIGALITLSYFLIFAHQLLRRPLFRRFGIALLILVGIQFTLGVLNILWLRPVWLALLHHGVAVTILLTTLTILVKTYHTRDHHYVR